MDSIRILLFLLGAVSEISCQTPSQVVTIKYGQVQGMTIPLNDGNNIQSFLRVPYGRAPVDELRFMPPEEPAEWDEVYQATEIGPSCYQSLVNTAVWPSHPGWSYMDEDCLHLNIFAPEDMDGSYPVMVWIHGGAYQNGASVLYPGYFLATRDVVVVVIQYRVDSLGFSFSGDGVIPGNVGMLDQVQALRFVQENIGAFGGDPGQVTIFGESAGAASVGLHLVSPMSEGLFERAILQSGCEYVYWAVNQPSQEPEQYTRQVAQQLNCPTDDSAAMLTCLQGVLPRRIINANVECEDGYDCIGPAPVVDGEGGFLPEMPADIRAKGEHHKVPIIIGVDKEDGYVFTILEKPGILIGGMNRSDFEEVISDYVSYYEPRLSDAERYEDIYEALKFMYTDWPDVEDLEKNRAMFGDFLTDEMFFVAANNLAKDHASEAPTYFYIYGHVTEDDDIIWPKWMGAFHASELVYTFGILFLKENDIARQYLNYSELNSDYTDEEYAFSNYVMDLWTDFAKFGNPTNEGSIPPGEDSAIMWPTYGTGYDDTFLSMYLDKKTEVITNYRQDYAAFWEEYINWLAFDNDPTIKMRRPQGTMYKFIKQGIDMKMNNE